MRKSWKVLSVAAVLTFTLASGTAVAQSGHPSAKATAQAGAINVLGAEGAHSLDDFTTILSNTVKTSRKSALFVDVSMECGLFTRTNVKSKGGTKETANAEAGVEVRVMVDGRYSVPGAVTFCHRSQELSATFQGLIDGCLFQDADNNILLDEECLLPEEIELVTRTMTANSYNFILNNVGTGVHNIEVQARVFLGSTESAGGEGEARATIGKGSVTIEEVRMIKDEDYLY
jgi:hypothetical protein